MENSCVCLYRQVFCAMHIIFNTVHSILDMNCIRKFQRFWRIVVRVKTCTDGKLNRMQKHFSILLESDLNYEKQFKMHFQPFRSTARNISEKNFCDPIYETCFCTSQWNNILISLYFKQYMYVKISFKNFPSIDRNVSENFRANLHTKYLYYLNPFVLCMFFIKHVFVYLKDTC